MNTHISMIDRNHWWAPTMALLIIKTDEYAKLVYSNLNTDEYQLN